jgi:hypothetical protein
MDERSRIRQFEAQFHQQLRTRAEALLRRPLPADRVVVESMPDGRDAVRATLNRLERYDRDLIEQLPGTRAAQLRFQRRTLGGLIARTVARVRAQALVPIEQLVAGQQPGPVGREAVLDALARYEVLPRREKPTAVIFASADGFSDDARALVNETRVPQIVLMGGRADGGWDVTMPDAVRKTSWAKLLEFETQDDRLKRLQYHLERNVGQLESRGISLEELAEQTGLPQAQIEALARRACRADARLMTVVHDGRVHLCRSPLAAETNQMSLWSRIRKLLRMKPTVAERVREMTAQRVALEQQRHEVDERVDRLETEERSALEQGAAARSDAERKQIAGRLARVRRDLRRVRAQAQVYTQQIDILGTHLHNLTLAEQGRRTAMPKAEELTQQAAEAEQIVSELAANADLATSVEVGAQTPMQEDEEAAIMAEFAQLADAQPDAAEAASEAPAERSAPSSDERVSRSTPESAAEASEPPAGAKRSEQDRTRPELG